MKAISLAEAYCNPSRCKHIRSSYRPNEKVQHLLSYPVISDGVHTFDSGKYGQRSIQFGNAAYQTFAATATTWFQKPYQHLLPYIQKVDSLGDNILHYVNKQFPIIKKPTQELYNDTKGLVSLLYHKALEGRDHVLKVYDSEYKKNKQVGLVAHGKAAVTTVLGVSNEALLAQLPFAPEEGRGNQYRQLKFQSTEKTRLTSTLPQDLNGPRPLLLAMSSISAQRSLVEI
ncbi:hypothetical protein FOQG_12785 [Fusarium oxysporum f. sp. raphani 54005]|uniref:Uncharacterized protein n=1 Tax=Fusarium oxysporum f. sp. raphani 54005 TaxID=1089458 RepID=X0BVK6_FUSOX|nr:hypothetical protein FOQG_12785 [Fusarium oxysporum f. sp. raphani 54005]KAJ4029029.1 hypothetical protein NW753_014403 [Fusarium oxysporum]KAJ4034914.1 hypothetical protein NW763_014145 [Fusarium oxysporum]KAJ4051391.1 hypothetical protein NW758_003734 [Fusarium oxysporum]KAJ4072789.1 hypothetical protein NW761_014617 [Fusarium oxysporum]